MDVILIQEISLDSMHSLGVNLLDGKLTLRGKSKNEQEAMSHRDRSNCRLHVITAELIAEISAALNKSSPIHFLSHSVLKPHAAKLFGKRVIALIMKACPCCNRPRWNKLTTPAFRASSVFWWHALKVSSSFLFITVVYIPYFWTEHRKGSLNYIFSYWSTFLFLNWLSSTEKNVTWLTVEVLFNHKTYFVKQLKRDKSEDVNTFQHLQSFFFFLQFSRLHNK